MNYNQSHQFYCGVDLHARSMFYTQFGTERFLRRRCLPVTVALPDGKVARPVKLFGAARLDASGNRKREPSRCCEKSAHRAEEVD
jgi:hypothetical protein